MQKKIISLILCMFLIIISTVVNADSAQVQMIGNDTIKKDEENIVYVKIENLKEVGVIEGKINPDNNIKDLTIAISFNEWTTTYNKDTGEFNSFNSSGIKDGQVIQIKYKLKEGATSGTLSIENIKFTTIDYQIIDLHENITKTVSVEVEKNTEETEKTQEQETSEKTEVSKDNTISKGFLPNAGISTLIFIWILLLVVVAVVIFVKVKEYRDVK